MGSGHEIVEEFAPWNVHKWRVFWKKEWIGKGKFNFEKDNLWFLSKSGMNFWSKLLSLPSWERGLKYECGIVSNTKIPSLPSWERGLKSGFYCFDTNKEPCRSLRGSVDWNTVEDLKDKEGGLSLPSWERGLKFSGCGRSGATEYESLPSWERGLKFLSVRTQSES